MPLKKKSTRKTDKPTGFKIYRDQKGRFISKAAWQSIPKRKRKSSAVAVQRDAKGRFVSEKFLPSKIKIAPEKKKAKPKAKIKVERCDFSKVFELKSQNQINKLNVTGVASLSVYCLSQLIANQIKRGAKLFRFWYKGEVYVKGDENEQGKIRSTPLINAHRVQNEFGSIEGFLQHLTGPVIYYWMDLYE